MSRYVTREWHPEERPTFPGSPSFPRKRSWPMRVAYLLVGAIVTLTGGLGNALVTANLVYLQGNLGAYYTETNWLPAAYVMTNATMNLLLVKFRQQFGLRLFAEMFLVLYALVTFAHLFVNDLQSAIAVRAAHGMVAAALSSLGLFYILQAFPRKETRLRGTVIGFGLSQAPLPLAYMFSSELLDFGNWRGLYIFELGLALLSLGCVLVLRLPPGDHFKVFRKLDFVTFLLFAPGVALLCAAVTFGRVLWWFEVPWIGYALACSVVLIMAAFFVEHMRKQPLLNVRWLTNFSIVRLGIGLVLVRIVLSEQSVGAVNFLRSVGLSNDQMQVLFLIVLLATLAGIAVAAVTINVDHLLAPQVIALVIMAIGAYSNSFATNLTRPEQIYASQAMMAFGGSLFLGPMAVSLISQVVVNPANLISFTVLFGMSQNLGGLIGSSLLGTFQVIREKYHSAILVDHLSQVDPMVAHRIQAGAQALASAISDPAARQRQGVAMLAASVRSQANLLAYNDVFLLIAAVAALHAAWVFGRAAWLEYFAEPAPAPVQSGQAVLPTD
jgi:MFS family permease